MKISTSQSSFDCGFYCCHIRINVFWSKLQDNAKELLHDPRDPPSKVILPSTIVGTWYVSKSKPHSSPLVNSNSKRVINVVSYAMIN